MALGNAFRFWQDTTLATSQVKRVIVHFTIFFSHVTCRNFCFCNFLRLRQYIFHIICIVRCCAKVFHVLLQKDHNDLIRSLRATNQPLLPIEEKSEAPIANKEKGKEKVSYTSPLIFFTLFNHFHLTLNFLPATDSLLFHLFT